MYSIGGSRISQAGGIVDRRDLVFLDDRLGGQSFPGTPGGDHVHLVLNGEFSDRGHRLRDLVGGIHQDHLDLASGNASLDFVDITEIVLLPLGMELPPGGCRAGQVDGGADLDVFGHSRSRPEQNKGQDG